MASVKFCRFCGQPIEEGKECSCQGVQNNQSSTYKNTVDTKASFASNIGILDKETRISFFEQNKQIVPDNIVANDGEVPIRQYNIATLRTLYKGAFAEGRLQVTNKRVIFRSAGYSLLGPNQIQHEFAINEIAGIEIRKDHRLGIFHFIFACIVLLIIGNIIGDMFNRFAETSEFFAGLFALVLFGGALIAFVGLKGKHFIKLLTSLIAVVALSSQAFSTKFLIVPVADNGFYTFLTTVCTIVFLINLIHVVFVPNLVIEIKTKGASSPIEIRRKESNGILAFMFNMPKKEYTGFSDVMPGKDTVKAMKELGAMINDINLLGDDAIKKWKEKE